MVVIIPLRKSTAKKIILQNITYYKCIRTHAYIYIYVRSFALRKLFASNVIKMLQLSSLGRIKLMFVHRMMSIFYSLLTFLPSNDAYLSKSESIVFSYYCSAFLYVNLRRTVGGNKISVDSYSWSQLFCVKT